MNARVLTMSLLAAGGLFQSTALSQTLPAASSGPYGPGIEVEAFQGPVRQLPEYRYDLRTGVGGFVSDPWAASATEVGGGSQNVLVTCYNNGGAYSGFGTRIPLGLEYVDWGDKACGMTQYIESFQIGYFTRMIDPLSAGPGASLDISFYQGTSGGGFAFLGTPIATISLAGLPGRTPPATAAAFSLVVTITSGPIPICDGDIGWGYVGKDGTATVGETGPLLMTTTGVCFGAPDPLGNEDCFDRYTAPASAGGYLSTNAFTTAGIAAFWLRLDEHNGVSSTSASVNGTNVNPVIFTETATPILAQPWNTFIDTTGFPGAIATAIAFCDSPFPPTIIGAGELFVDVSTPSLLFIDIALNNHTNVAPKDISLVGNTIHTQSGVWDGSLHLGNGIDFTLGL